MFKSPEAEPQGGFPADNAASDTTAISAADRDAFARDLEALIPSLRSFARSLCRSPTEADDLAQEALLRAWRAQHTFTPGTSLKAWAFTILRNRFYSERRTAARTQALDQGMAEQTLVAVSNPQAHLELEELRQALAMLPPEQREAVILIGAGEMTYDEVATMAGLPIGTIKSRLSRGRAALAGLCDVGVADGEPASPHGPVHAIFELVERSRRRIRDLGGHMQVGTA